MGGRLSYGIIVIGMLGGMIASGIAGIALGQMKLVPQLASLPPEIPKDAFMKPPKPVTPQLPVTIGIRTSDTMQLTIRQAEGTFSLLHTDTDKLICYRADGSLKQVEVKASFFMFGHPE